MKKLEREELKKELKEVELKRIEYDMYGSTRDEYIAICEKEKKLREKIYGVDYRNISKEEVADFVRKGY